MHTTALVRGFFNAQNLGDNSYIDAFRILFSEIDFDFTSKIVDKNNYSNYILGGGNVLFSSYLNEFKDIKKNKLALSVSCNEKSDFGTTLKSFHQILVRDYISQVLLEQHGIRSTYAPDFAIALPSNKYDGKDLIERLFKNEKRELKEKVVIVVVNSHLLYPNHPRTERDEIRFLQFANDFADCMDNTNASFIFLPFGTGDWHDSITNGWVSHKAKWFRKNLVIYDRLDVETTLNIIAAADLTISSRLHPNIFSFAASVPFIGISADSKINGFCDSVNRVDWCLSYYDWNRKELQFLVDLLLRDSYNTGVKLTEEVKHQKGILKDVIKNVRFD